MTEASSEASPAVGGSLPEYGRAYVEAPRTFAYLDPVVMSFVPTGRPLRVLDVGCGNGHWARRLAGAGHRVVGVDASAERIALARDLCPESRFEQLEIVPDLLSALSEEPFDLVVSTEVVEHLLLPKVWAAACRDALVPGGRFVCSTPYHGYLKNLMIALSGKWDRHHQPNMDLGHIKFFSEFTLRRLLAKAGFEELRFAGAGRFPYLWKSMVMAADRP